MQKLSITKDMSPTEIKLAVIKVVSGLDFHSIRETMTALQWTWQTDTRPPEQTELFDAATERGISAVVECISNQKRSKISSGGFTADAEMFPEGDIGLSVWFEVTEYNNYL
jgi:hypothetical protein